VGVDNCLACVHHVLAAGKQATLKTFCFLFLRATKYFRPDTHRGSPCTSVATITRVFGKEIPKVLVSARRITLTTV
jgi:hypothetical protein